MYLFQTTVGGRFSVARQAISKEQGAALIDYGGVRGGGHVTSKQAKKYQTQWAAQYYVAAELTRRGYLVSLTMGNAPVADLLVVSPDGIQFEVDVKGQSTRNFWLIQQREPQDNLFFVLVYLPKNGEVPHFYILSSAKLMHRREEYRRRIESQGGNYRDALGGINWSTALDYRDQWETLPS